MVMFLPTMMLRVMLPKLTSLSSSGEGTIFRRTFKIFVGCTGISAAAIALMVGVGGQHLLALFGREFRDPNHVVPLILVATVLEAVSGSFSQLLIIRGRMWHQLCAMAMWSVLLVSVSAVNSHSGAYGVALATITAWAITLGIYLGIARGKQLPKE
jgi:O-antigen/teichoic acid export membrane protein